MIYLPRVSASDFEIEPTPFYRGAISNLFIAKVRKDALSEFDSNAEYVIKRLKSSFSADESSAYFKNLDQTHSAITAQPQKLLYLESRLTLPKAVITNRAGNELAFLMRKLDHQAECKLRMTEGYKTRIQELKLFMNSPTERSTYQTPRVSRTRLFNVIDDLLQTLSNLHSLNLVVGDLSSSNLVLETKPGARRANRCVFLDVDSFSSEHQGHPLGTQTTNLYWTPEQIAGENHLPSSSADVYKAALLIIRLLTQTCDYANHSFDLNSASFCKPALLELGGPELLSLIQKCLSDDPMARPTSEFLSTKWRAFMKVRNFMK
jgi:serine/threonine protein kinase